MKNIFFLVLALLFFGLAFYIYWIVAQENATGLSPAAPGATRSLGPRSGGPGASQLMVFVQKWQPYLTLASSLGGILSFLFQVRVWMRGKA